MSIGRTSRSRVQATRWLLSLGRRLQARRSTAARTGLLLASLTMGAVAQPVADFTANPKHGAKPLQVSFIDLSTSSVPITSWLWDFGDSATSTAQHPIKTYTASGSYAVSLTVTTSQGDDSVIKAGFISVPPPNLFGPDLVLPNSPTSHDVAVADFNGDGVPDLLATKANSSVGVHWWPSLGAAGGFGPAQLITDESPAASTIDTADIDGDGDMDVLAGYVQLDKVVWHENTDGLGAFGPERSVVSFALTCSGVDSGDIDGDGDIDVLSTLALAGKLAWNANSGAGTFGPKTILATFGSSGSGVLSSRLADLDGDGDLDVLAGYGYSAGPGLPGQNNQLLWFANADSLGGYGGAQLIDAALSLPGAIEGVDLDDDGDLDVLAASAYDGQINWYENTDGAASFGLARVIRHPVVGTAQVVSFTTADVDLDGDLDVVTAEGIPDRLVLHENMDGLVDSWNEVLVSSHASPVRDVVSADFDLDGDIDLAFGTTGLAWHPNALGSPAWPYLGDALPGGAGRPWLFGQGELSAGSTVTLEMYDALPGSISALVIGLASVSVPFKGGVLVPNPDVILAGLPVGSIGELLLSATWPGGSPAGIPLWFQYWIADPAGPAGFSASNATMGTTSP